MMNVLGLPLNEIWEVLTVFCRNVYCVTILTVWKWTNFEFKLSCVLEKSFPKKKKHKKYQITYGIYLEYLVAEIQLTGNFYKQVHWRESISEINWFLNC